MSLWSALLGSEAKVRGARNDANLSAALSIPAGDSDSDRDNSHDGSLPYYPIYNNQNNSNHDISFDVEAGGDNGNAYTTEDLEQQDEAPLREREAVAAATNVTQDTFIQDLLQLSDDDDDDDHSITAHGTVQEDGDSMGGVSFLQRSTMRHNEDDAEREVGEAEEEGEGELDIVAYLQQHNEHMSQILHAAAHEGSDEETVEELGGGMAHMLHVQGGMGSGSGGLSPVLNRSLVSLIRRPTTGTSSNPNSNNNSRPLSRNSSISPTERGRDYFLDQKTIKDFGDESSMVSIEAEELYNQLHELEEATSKLQSIYSSTRNFPLTSEKSLFVDVESGGRDIRADFELVDDLQDQEVLTLKIFCLPSFILEEDCICHLSKLRIPGIDFLPLQFRLSYHGVLPPHDRDPCKIYTKSQRDMEGKMMMGESSSVSSDNEKNAMRIEVKPVLYNGEYCITLTNAHQHSLKQGYYSLYVNAAEDIDDPLYAQRNDDTQTQSVQISYQIYSMVSATAMSSNSVVQDRIAQHNGVKFYRFVLTDPKKYVKFSLKPLLPTDNNDTFNDVDQDFDMDMFITNQYDGLVPVDKENYRWCSFSATSTSVSGMNRNTSVNSDKRSHSVIEVLPTDPRLSAALPLLLQQQQQQGERGGLGQDDSLFSFNSSTDIDNHIQTFTIGIYCTSLFANHNDYHRSEEDQLNERFPQGFYPFQFEIVTMDYLPVIHSHSLMTSDHKSIGIAEHDSLDEEKVGMGGGVMENEVSQCVVKELVDGIATTELSYHAIPVNPYYPSQILVSLQVTPSNVLSSGDDKVLLSRRFKSMDEAMKSLKIQKSIAGGGKLLKCSKLLPMNVPGFDEAYTAFHLAEIESLLKSSSTSHAPSSSSSSTQTFVFTVLYLSHTYFYPGPHNYHYRATGDTEVSFYINSNEWKYSSNACYFSIYVCEFDVAFIDELLKVQRNPKIDGDLVDYLVKRKGICHSMETGVNGSHDDEEMIFVNGVRGKRIFDRPLLHIWRECLEDSGTTSITSTSTATHVSSHQSKLSSKLSLFHKIFRSIDGDKLTYRDREGVDFTTYPFEPLCPQYFAKNGSGVSNVMMTTMDFSRSTAVLGIGGGGGGGTGWSIGMGLDETLRLKNSLSTSMIRVRRIDDDDDDGESARETDEVEIEVDDATLTYSEIEFVSFVTFLHSLPAVDGEIFYDLGCGVGKALVASALSGICFLKVVGFEALPSLATCCMDVIQSLQNQTQELNSSKLHELMRSPVKGLSDGRGGHQNQTPTTKVFATRGKQGSGQPTRLFSSPNSGVGIGAAHEDSLIAWLTNRNQLDGTAAAGDASFDNNDDNMSMNSFLTQSSCSYQLTAIPDLKERLKKAKVKLPIMEVRNENFLDNLSWLEADIVFASSLCYSDLVVKTMIEKAQGLKPGSRLITSKLSKNYSRWFDLMKTVTLNLSCGEVVFHVLMRNKVATM